MLSSPEQSACTEVVGSPPDRHVREKNKEKGGSADLALRAQLLCALRLT